MDIGARRVLDGPLPAGLSYGSTQGGLAWSSDGKRIAYFVGPSPYPEPGPAPRAKPERYDVYVRDVSAGRARLLENVRGGPPGLFWSPDGRRLLVCVASTTPGPYGAPGCGGDPKVERGRLLLVDTESRTTRVVARGRLIFAGWAHSEGLFAYANEGGAAFLATVEGKVRKLADAPTKGWPPGEWLGFSPDDRYLGLGNFSGRLAVLDVATGRVEVLLREPKDAFFEYRKWWR